MKYEILNDNGEVINTIVADESFVQEHYPEKYRLLPENPDIILMQLSQEARAKRDGLLMATDWIVIKSLETSSPVPAEYLTYRQALRDLPSQSDFPTNIVWPSLFPEPIAE